MGEGLPDIYSYNDYRAFLVDFYQAEKERSAGFSHRAFARRAGLASPNYLKLVIDGLRPVTQKNISCFLKGLKLVGSEAEYFRLLVGIKENPDEGEKAAMLEKVLRLKIKNTRNPRQIDKDRWEILKSWHHWAIREMVLLKDFTKDPRWISRRLGKKISAAQAEESLALLQRLEFLRYDAGAKRLIQSDPMITTTDEISNLIIRHLHRQFIEIGLISLFHDPVEEREINGLSLALSEDELPLLKKMLKDFRKEVNRQFSQPGKPRASEVYHLQTMFFPVTKGEEKGRCEV